MKIKNMKAHKKTIIASCCVLIMTAIFAVLFTSGNTMVLGSEENYTDDVVSSNGAMTALVPDDEDKVFCSISGYVPPLSFDEMTEESTLVIYGRVTQKEQILIRPVQGGDPVGHTDYSIEPISILRGEPIKGDSVKVRTISRETEYKNVTTICEYIEDLNVGDEYLLFLYSTELGGGFNTKGDYYYVVGINQGIFEVSGKSTMRSSSGEVLPSKASAMFNTTELAYKDVSKEIQVANIETPIDLDLDEKIVLNNLDENLKSGFISQEEYQQALSELEQYATIVD